MNNVQESACFASHSSSDLKYRLVSGRVALEPMIVLDRRTISWGDWTVVFYVLGASHAMRIKRGKSQLTEILTCGGPLISGNSIAEVGMGRAGCVSAVAHNLSFTCRIRSESLPTGKSSSGRMIPGEFDNMEHEYPNPDLDVSSWTRLRWQVTDRNLRLETEHTYPHEGVSILSETTVTKERGHENMSIYGR